MSEIEQLVLKALVAEHGSEAVTRRPSRTVPEIPIAGPADYALGILAARKLADNARSLMRDYALKARSEGTPWPDLAQALGVDKDEDGETVDDPGAAAFETIVRKSRPYDRGLCGWYCANCGEWITDSGPYSANPADNETGHSHGCARHAAEIEAWRKRMGDDW